VGLRIYLPGSGNCFITANAEFEDHRVRWSCNDNLVPVSRYIADEEESTGRKPEVSDGVSKESDVDYTAVNNSLGDVVHRPTNIRN